MTKFILAFTILALVAAVAGTVTGGPSYKVTLLQPSVVKGTELKPGEYKLTLLGDKVSLERNKVTVDVSATIETVEKKFESTAVQFAEKDGKAVISEIRVGGTKTKVVFSR